MEVDALPVGARRALWIATALVLLVLPLGLTATAGWAPLLELDRTVSDELVRPGPGSDVDVLRALTTAGLLPARVLVLVPLVAWLAAGRRWQLVGFVVTAGIGVSLANQLLKAVFERARPSYEGGLDLAGFSFPSGHSAGVAALGAFLLVLAWPVIVVAWRRVAIGLALLGLFAVGFTRIALGVHYLSDVVAGWSFGLAWVLLLAVVLQVWPGQPGALPGRAGGRSPLNRPAAARR